MNIRQKRRISAACFSVALLYPLLQLVAAEQDIKREISLLKVVEIPAGIEINERIVRVSREADGHVLNVFTLATVKVTRDAFEFEIAVKEGGTSVEQASVSILNRTNEDNLPFEKEFVVLNGGFINEYSNLTPSGFAKANGEMKSELRSLREDPVLSAVVCTRGGDFKFTPVPDFGREETENLLRTFIEYDECVQTGPMLVYRKQITPLDDKYNDVLYQFSSEYYSRSFLLRDGNGDIIFGVSSPTTLKDLVSALVEQEDRMGLGAIDVVGLQGSASSALQVYGDGRPLYSWGRTTAPQSSVIIAKKRRK